MEPTGGRAGAALIERLRKESRRFEFVQAATLLQRLLAAAPGDSPVRYEGHAGLAFPSAEGELIALPSGDPPTPGRLRAYFLGLTGIMGVLPAHYAELLEGRRRAGDQALGDFLRLFEHRLLDLFLAAHRRSRYWLAFAWQARLGARRLAAGGNSFEEMLLGLVGTATSDLRWRAGLPPAAQIHYAGILAQKPRSADALRHVITDYFGVDTSVEQFRGDWVAIPAHTLRPLGDPRAARLGDDLVLGDRYYDPSRGMRLSLGPMPLDRLDALLPGTPAAAVLQDFVHFAVGAGQPFDYTLILRAEDVPPARLTSAPEAPQRLGWTAWLRSTDDPRDAVSGPFAPAATPSARGEPC